MLFGIYCRGQRDVFLVDFYVLKQHRRQLRDEKGENPQAKTSFWGLGRKY